MANLIQIKRSTSTATPSSLANGELAYTSVGDVLYIGSASQVVAIGGKRNPGVLTANQALIANSSSAIDKVIVANLQPTAVYANGSLGTSGQILTSNGTAVYWSTPTGTSNTLDGLDDVDTTGVAQGDLLGYNGSSWVDYDVTAANGISVTANATGLAISAVANNGLISNTSGLFVRAGTGTTVNSTGVHIGQNVSTTSNVTFANVVSNFITVNQDLAVSGNLTVTGSLVTLNVSTVSVIDPLIELAANNAANIIDIGIYGKYNDGTARYSGLFRDATDGLYKLYANSTVQPTTTVDTGGTGYTQATLQAYLNSGALVSNSSAVTLTANSTVTVNITANTLSLSTPLSGVNGGTGLSSYTNQDILVANSTNGFNKLSLGTDGYVLQSNGTALIYSTLDGGTF